MAGIEGRARYWKSVSNHSFDAILICVLDQLRVRYKNSLGYSGLIDTRQDQPEQSDFPEFKKLR